MSDNNFIGTACRVHQAKRFNNQNAMKRLVFEDGSEGKPHDIINQLSELAKEETEEKYDGAT